MNNPIFPILGSRDITLIGRKAEVKAIWNRLTKPTPDNVTVVGPRNIGKSTVLKEIGRKAASPGSPYSLVIYWEMAATSLRSDDDFVTHLCGLLLAEMRRTPGVYKDYIEALEKDKSFDTLTEVLGDFLESDGKAVLMIWDGFDKPLAQGYLSAQLFSNLRSLFNFKCHKVVTVTRKPLTELARNQQVEDSLFINMLYMNKELIGPLGQEDQEEAMRYANLVDNSGGAKELQNWSGGIPVLFFSLLNALVESGKQEFNNQDVCEVAKLVSQQLSDHMDKAWDECPATVKGVLLNLVEKGELNDGVGKDDLKYLEGNGFSVQTGKKIRATCRLFTDHVRGEVPDAGTLGRLFGTWESYRNEIRNVLELRLNQIPIMSARLHRLVKRCVEDVPNSIEDCLNNLTFIEEEALSLVWSCELGSANVIPNELVRYWTQYPRENDSVVKKMAETECWEMPKDRSRQLAILQRLTGSKDGFERRSKRISKETYVLFNTIHHFRNRTEHSEGQSIHEGAAIAAVLMCIELLSCLANELGQ